MTLDKNILIAYLSDEKKVVDSIQQWKASGRSLIISTVTRAELLSWPKLNSDEVRTTRQFLEQFISIPVDDRIADLVGLLRRKYSPLGLPDAAIAATALTFNSSLTSRDRIFRKIEEIELIPL